MSGSVRIAYFVTPHTGGTFHTFQNLRVALAPFGYELMAVSIGKMEWNGWWEKKLADESCVRLEPNESDLTKAVKALVAWIEELDVRFVIPLCNVVALSAIPYLPGWCQVVSRVSSTSKMGLRLAVPDEDRVSAIIAHTPGHVRELQRLAKKIADRVVLIPHGVDLSTFHPCKGDVPLNGDKLRILYLGRLSIYDKGVDRLKPICDALSSVTDNFTLSVVGGGLDQGYLKQKLRSYESRGLVQFCPPVLPQKVPLILREHDVLLMPSRFEGFPNTLVEAMACGAVPVASLLSGITDFIVDDGESGFLCPQNEPRYFAERLSELCRDRLRLQRMKEKAVKKVESQFSLTTIGAMYHKLFQKLIEHPKGGGRRLGIPSRVPYHPLVRPRRLVAWRRKVRALLARWGLWQR